VGFVPTTQVRKHLSTIKFWVLNRFLLFLTHSFEYVFSLSAPFYYKLLLDFWFVYHLKLLFLPERLALDYLFLLIVDFCDLTRYNLSSILCYWRHQTVCFLWLRCQLNDCFLSLGQFRLILHQRLLCHPFCVGYIDTFVILVEDCKRVFRSQSNLILLSYRLVVTPHKVCAILGIIQLWWISALLCVVLVITLCYFCSELSQPHSFRLELIMCLQSGHKNAESKRICL
jgi:hypothetical protein